MEVIIPYTKPFGLDAHSTGRELHQRLGLNHEDELVLHHEGHERVIGLDERCAFVYGDRLSCRPRKHAVTILVNRIPITFLDPRQTGQAIKEKANVPLNDVLFLDVPGAPDEIVSNSAEICLREGACFFTQPGADYGSPSLATVDLPVDAVVQPQPDGWTFVTLRDQPVPAGYQPARTDILVKLPPGFPDAGPDMFWCNPPIALATGGVPQASSPEVINGAAWQRFSWHLRPGAWQPGISTFADYLRCVRGRFATGL